MFRTRRRTTSFGVFLGVLTVIMAATSGCKETGRTVSNLGTQFQQGLTEKDRTAIVAVTTRIQALNDQLKADMAASDKAEKYSPQMLDKTSSELDQIDVSMCPDDFRQQFYKYKADFGVASNDWEEFAVYARDHHDDWFGDPKTEITRLEHRFDQAVDQSDSDVTELFAIAHKHGV